MICDSRELHLLDVIEPGDKWVIYVSSGDNLYKCQDLLFFEDTNIPLACLLLSLPLNNTNIPTYTYGLGDI